MELDVAIKAFIVNEGKVLILKEDAEYGSQNTGKWDVPGGRVKEGEKFDESILREIKEETGIKAKLGNPFHISEWRPIIKGEKRQIIGTFLKAYPNSKEVKLSKDHNAYKWINPEDYKNYNLVDQLPKVFENFLKN